MKVSAHLLAGILVVGTLRVAAATAVNGVGTEQESTIKPRVMETMRKAAAFFRTKVAIHGGYVYYYSVDLKQRWGEGKADAEEIWVQPPGTPTVGLAYLEAFEATKDPFYLDAGRDAAMALVQGQLESGGWANSIDFRAAGKNAPRYRKLPGGNRNHSSLDDGITQNALRLLMRADQALGFKNAEIHEASAFAREHLLEAQFVSGGFPQGWSGPVAKHPSKQATFPDYDWRTENRIKEYWDLPTLNDNLVGHLAETLEEAWNIYRDERYKQALTRLGDFLILAQMPEPQPAWAQQYDHDMHPVWARKFEPPAIAGRESIGAIKTLLQVHRLTRKDKYLEPIPRAIAYLERSRLPDGQLARYYELKSNRPLYMNKEYQLTYHDTDLPAHYGWKTSGKFDSIRSRYEKQSRGSFSDPARLKIQSGARVEQIISSLDSEGRWVTEYDRETLTGQPKFTKGMPFISSEVFAENLTTLSHFLRTSP